MGGWFVDIFVEWLVRMIVKIVRRINSRSWPVVETIVTASVYSKAGYGCDTTDLHFDYSFDGQEYSGLHEEPFIMADLAKDFALDYPAGANIKVRLKPSRPYVTVALV
ncbi:MAG: hypothetical protein ABSE46_02260 [Terracidiphilus sp.]|jgi:hypothetical protein